MTKDARDILIDCCVEFISLVSSEANDIMERESKKTISPEHVGDALKELGFPEYVQEVLATAGDQKEQLKVCPRIGIATATRCRGFENDANTLSSHGKRRRARWIKVDCLKRSWRPSSGSCSKWPPTSTTKALQSKSWLSAERIWLAFVRLSLCLKADCVEGYSTSGLIISKGIGQVRIACPL